MNRADLGYFDEGWDLRDPAFYGDSSRQLPPAAVRSLAFTHLEDEAVWTRDWICVGGHADIPAAGDLLPFTVGDHGIHVQREAEDRLVARFNKAQHGGCRAVPLQCQTGTKTRCSFTSCGHSRDRDAIPAGELGDGTPEMHQYLGLRPERLLTAHVASWGPLIFVNLDVKPVPLDARLAGLGASGKFFGNHKSTRAAHVWIETEANWKLAAQHLAEGAITHGGPDWSVADTLVEAGVPAKTVWMFPNLVLIAADRWTAALIVQPTAIGQTLCRVAVYGEAAEAARAEIEARLAAARVEQNRRAKWGTQSNPETIGVPPEAQESAIGRWGQSALASRVLALPTEPSAIPLFQIPRS